MCVNLFFFFLWQQTPMYYYAYQSSVNPHSLALRQRLVLKDAIFSGLLALAQVRVSKIIEIAYSCSRQPPQSCGTGRDVRRAKKSRREAPAFHPESSLHTGGSNYC